MIDILNYYKKTNKILDLLFAKLLIRQILAGLVYIHNVCGLIHTDIKPENILIKSNAQLANKLILELTKKGKIP